MSFLDFADTRRNNNRRRRGTEANSFSSGLDDISLFPILFNDLGTGGGTDIAFTGDNDDDEDPGGDDDIDVGGGGNTGGGGSGGGNTGGGSAGFQEIDVNAGDGGQGPGIDAPAGPGIDFSGIDINGADIGGFLGGAAGSALGPVGSFAGGIIGDFIGGLFDGDDQSGGGADFGGAGFSGGEGDTSLGEAPGIDVDFGDISNSGIGGAAGGGAAGGGADFGGAGFSGGEGDTGLSGGAGSGVDVDFGDISNSGIDGGGGGDGGKVICTELLRQGLFCPDLYDEEVRLAHLVSDRTRAGYHLWAVPYVRLMRRSRLATRIVRPLAIAWAEQHTGRRNSIAGYATRLIGQPLCWLLGFVPTSTDHRKLYGGEHA